MNGWPNDCGGCEGLGSHRRWCPAVVGPHAALLGMLSEKAERLGDSVGPNHMGAANHLWRASGLLREEAQARAEQHRQGTG